MSPPPTAKSCSKRTKFLEIREVAKKLPSNLWKALLLTNRMSLQKTSLNKSYIRTVARLPTIALFIGRCGVNISVEKRFWVCMVWFDFCKKPNNVRTLKFRSYGTNSKIQEHWIRSSVFSYWMPIYFEGWEDGFVEWCSLIVLQYFVSSILNTLICFLIH